MPLLLPKPVDPHNAGMRQTLQTLDLSVESSAKFRFIRYAIRDELHRDRLFGFLMHGREYCPHTTASQRFANSIGAQKLKGR